MKIKTYDQLLTENELYINKIKNLELRILALKERCKKTIEEFEKHDVRDFYLMLFEYEYIRDFFNKYDDIEQVNINNKLTSEISFLKSKIATFNEKTKEILNELYSSEDINRYDFDDLVNCLNIQKIDN